MVDLPSLVVSFQQYATADTLEKSLRNEIEILTRLRHRNIVHLIDAYWLEGGQVYICMELIEGRSLLQCVPPGGMAEEAAKNYFYQIALAVSYCHAHDVGTFL